VLTFFIAGLLFICASSTSITWERTASRSETGLLIPSAFVNYEPSDLQGLYYRAIVANMERPMRRLGWFFSGLLITTCVFVSQAQNSSHATKHVEIASIPARQGDVSTLDGIMKAYYETGTGPANQQRQWARDRTLYVPGVRFIVFMDENGKPVARQFSYQEFADMVDPIQVKNGFYEHEIHRLTYRYGNWAHVISTSEARTNPTGPVTGHGIDNVELFWDGTRWWITHASIVEERANEPFPKEYLP
jgi:hypothetical protein